MIDEKLPTHYSEANKIINIYQKIDAMPKIEQLCDVLIKLDEENKEAKTIKSNNYNQDFDLYHLMGLCR